MDVPEGARHTQRRTLGVAEGLAARTKPAIFAALGRYPVLDVIGGVAAAIIQVPGECVQSRFAVLRV